MTTQDPSPVELFARDLNDARRTLFEAVHAVITSTAPELHVETAGKMLGYGPFHYRYSSGREGDAHAIAISNGAAAMSVHVLGVENGAYLTESYAERLGKVSVGKSCIRIKKHGDLDLNSFAELVKNCALRHAAGTLLVA